MYLLCRPKGGLNDSLCQIEKCLNYSKKYNRTLIVDTTRNEQYIEHFNEYFIFNDDYKNIITSVDSELMLKLNKMSCYPKIIEGKLDTTYYLKYNSDLALMVVDDIKISFEFDQDYNEDIIVYEQCGGGILSLNLLKKIKFKKEISDIIKKRIKDIKNYDAIHIRNTDLKTDYKTFFSEIYDNVVDKNLVVCSDDVEVLKYSKTFFDKSNVIINDDIFDNNGNPLHIGYKPNYKSIIINIFVDMVLLSLSDKLYIKNVDYFNEEKIKNRISGFSLLVQKLNMDKSIIYNLLN